MNDYQRSIDGLRGLAILLIIMFHCNVCYFGWSGVILFFVLSGYLITKVLWVEKEKANSLKIKFRNFWARRVLRIFPLYYLYLFILAILLLFKFAPELINSEMPWLFTYTYNFYLISVYDTRGPSFFAGHLWTLSIEEQFYLFYPFMILLFKRKHVKIAVIILIIISVLFRFYYSFYQSTTSNAFLDFHQVSYLDSFLVGAAIYIFNFERMRPSKGFLFFLVCTLIVLIGGLFMYMDVYRNQPFSINNYLSSFGIEPHYTKNYYRVWGLIQLNFFFSALLLLLLLPAKNRVHGWFKRIFEFWPIVSIGKVSYGMYVFHAIIIWLLINIFKKESVNKYLFFVVCTVVIWLVSIIVYHLYEKRFLVLKKKFR
jgi:peptidoglycan/LPS O-acetylase OafA/YrhL